MKPKIIEIDNIANVIIEGYWSNSLMNGAVLNVGGGIQDSHVRGALRMFPGNNGNIKV